MRAAADPQGRYQEALSNIPPAGCGNGTHAYLLSIANRARAAGYAPDKVFEDMRAMIPKGKRRVSDGEIQDALKKAYEHDFIPRPQPKPITSNGPLALRNFIAEGAGTTEADIWEASPIRIDWTPEEDAWRLLEVLAGKDDLFFIGDGDDFGIVGGTIRAASEWIELFQRGVRPGPHVIPNPLDGKPHPRKDDPSKVTYRGDACIAVYRRCTVEYDNLDRDSQLAFWATVNAPVVALIDSGGKSIHGWLDVQKWASVESPEEWDLHIKDELYQRLLIPLGVDRACCNAARLSRMPGHFRDTGRWQRILWLSPEGRKVF
jgi:hypothetical protein